MPLLAALIKALFGSLSAVLVAIATLRESIRITGVLALAAVYIAAVGAYSAFVSPLIGVLFATSYGQVIGLAFPPVAGTVISGLSLLWGTLLAKRFIVRFGAMALPK